MKKYDGGTYQSKEIFIKSGLLIKPGYFHDTDMLLLQEAYLEYSAPLQRVELEIVKGSERYPIIFMEDCEVCLINGIPYRKIVFKTPFIIQPLIVWKITGIPKDIKFIFRADFISEIS